MLAYRHFPMALRIAGSRILEDAVATTEQVTVTLPAETLTRIDHYERNCSRFIADHTPAGAIPCVASTPWLYFGYEDRRIG